eukprot:gene1215-1325_t
MEIFRSLGNLVAPGRFPSPALPDPQRVMTCVIMDQHGPPDVLHLVDNFPAPTLKPNSRQVLVNVCGAGINPLDCKMRKGPIANFLYPKPKISGLDISGIVEKAPEDSIFKPGDRVYSMLPLLGTQYGGYASQCVVEENILAHAPAGFDLVDLATIPLVSCTVIQAFRSVISTFKGVTKGLRCFISAGSGGLGSFAVQYCSKVLEMHVIASCSSTNKAFVESLGAAEIVDYRTEHLKDRVQDVDVFFDSMGYLNENDVWGKQSRMLRKRKTSTEPPSVYIRIASSPFSSSGQALAPDPLGLAVPEARLDRMLSGFVKQFWHSSLFNADVQYYFVLVTPDRAALEETASHLREGKIQPTVQRRFLLAEAPLAHTIQEEGHVVGKLVLEVNGLLAQR